eukprot:gnl/MRDRNA2_/MRDRNA2_59595_c0_seq1.p1 gnl/MRDRNA2_/MRDRNA2_59595_c0~~gnl/MRDRNA2_/MRDRNA2_59595_c0_seq1.p1  ORF type:complete len:439 (+),score=74.67 gnl/MRDRNA2_/MRDRNA2_59595_c0_seq1:82-1398(+)
MPHLATALMSGSRHRACGYRSTALTIAAPAAIFLYVVNQSSLKFDGWPAKLDYGIYFFSAQNVPQKYEHGVSNSYFDPSRPTMIYFHGWEHDSVKRRFRETFDYHSNQPKDCPHRLLESKSWVKDGWNIGIFYWDQFADEASPGDAEAKIWTSDVEMRYMTSSKGYQTAGVPPGMSVTDLFIADFSSLVKISSGQTPKEVIFAGGSLGAQLAVHAAAILQDKEESGTIGSGWVPARIALLDPFFSGGMTSSESFLPHGESTASLINKEVARLKDKGNVIFELHRTSPISDLPAFVADADNKLKKYAVYVRRHPGFCKGGKDDSIADQSPIAGIFGEATQNIPGMGGIGQTLSQSKAKLTCEHTAAWNLYFLSKGYAPPPLCGAPSTPSDFCSTPSSSCTNSGLKQLVSAVLPSHKHFVQAGGMDTISIDDDCFELRSD